MDPPAAGALGGERRGLKEASRRDELTPEELPPEWTQRAFKDPVACREELFVRPARTPCEAAWKVRAYRNLVFEWLVESGGGGRRSLIFVVQMPDRTVRFALFVRQELLVHGERLIVVRDNLSSSVFAGRRSYAAEPAPAPCVPRVGARKARSVRRKASQPRRKR